MARRPKKTKLRTFKLENDVWQYALFVRIGGTKEQAVEWFTKKFGEPPSEDVNFCRRGATIFADGELSHMIWFESIPGASLVSHEAFHSVRHVLVEAGMPVLTEDNEEAYAYLLTWTVQQIGQRLW